MKIWSLYSMQIFTFVEMNTSKYFSMQDTYSPSVRGEYVYFALKNI